MSNLKITNTLTQDLKAYKNHSREHSKAKLSKLAKLIEEFGFLIPILIDSKNKEIIAGHARLLAAQELGLEEVPTIPVGHLSSEQIRAFRIADNKITEGSEWNLDALKAEFVELKVLDFDLSLTAFEIPEIDMIILGEDGAINSLDDEIPKPPENPVVQKGDVLQLGKHRVACIDCRDELLMGKLIDGQAASLVITDPPYNVKVNGHVLSQTKTHAEFAMASGEMTKDEFTLFLTEVFSVCNQYSGNGSLHYHFIDHKHVEEMLEAGTRVYDKRLNICVWNKTNAGMGSLYRSQHEFCCVFKKGDNPHTNNIQLGKFGRHRTNVWTYPGMNTFSENRDELLSAHPTVKNTQMIADIILDASKPDEVVLDGFLGSGTTLLAAEQTGRVCYGSEIEPKYIEVCIARFQAISEEPVIHIESGLTFEELTHLRLKENKPGEDHAK
jgi:DNA modification methylase